MEYGPNKKIHRLPLLSWLHLCINIRFFEDSRRFIMLSKLIMCTMVMLSVRSNWMFPILFAIVTPPIHAIIILGYFSVLLWAARRRQMSRTIGKRLKTQFRNLIVQLIRALRNSKCRPPQAKTSLPPDAAPPQEDAPAFLPPTNLTPDSEDNGYTVVRSGRRQKKIKKSYNMVSAPTPANPDRTAAPTYKGPPPELYHGKGATVENGIDGKSIYYYQLRYHKDLRRCKTVGYPVAIDFQKLYGTLKKLDLNLLLVLPTEGALTPEYQDRSRFPYIDRRVKIPINSKKEFKNYLLYTFEREQVNRVFAIRTTKLL